MIVWKFHKTEGYNCTKYVNVFYIKLLMISLWKVKWLNNTSIKHLAPVTSTKRDFPFTMSLKIVWKREYPVKMQE